jgi:hypothetical protein
MGIAAPFTGIDLGRTIVKPARYMDAAFIAQHMRRDDIREIQALGRSPLESMRRGLLSSARCFTAVHDGRPVLMFGIVDDMEAPGIFGSVWMLATDDLKLIRRPLIKHGKEILMQVSAGYTHIGNGVASFNTEHIRWLKWMGFSFYNTYLVGEVEFQSFGRFVDHV